MGLFDNVFITLDCPICQYGIDVELLSVRLEEIIYCPCCKATIQLVDEEASMHVSQEGVDSAMADFESALKRLNMTIEIKL